MSARTFLAASVLALLSSCTTTVPIRSTWPGPVVVGPTEHLVGFDGEGRRSAREFLTSELANLVRERGFFRFTDRSEADVSIRVAGRRVIFEGEHAELDPDQAGLRIDVLEWSAGRDVVQEQRRTPEGEAFAVDVPVQRGTALLQMTLFDAGGHAWLAEAEYEGTFTTPDLYVQRDLVIEEAGRDALRHFLADITPVVVVTRVRLDDSDDGQSGILESARGGAMAQAAADMQRYLESHPNSGSAAYNLGVFLEATGDFEAALASYDRALSLGGPDYYAGARAQCARRLEAQRQLGR